MYGSELLKSVAVLSECERLYRMRRMRQRGFRQPQLVTIDFQNQDGDQLIRYAEEVVKVFTGKNLRFHEALFTSVARIVLETSPGIATLSEDPNAYEYYKPTPLHLAMLRQLKVLVDASKSFDNRSDALLRCFVYSKNRSLQDSVNAHLQLLYRIDQTTVEELREKVRLLNERLSGNGAIEQQVRELGNTAFLAAAFKLSDASTENAFSERVNGDTIGVSNGLENAISAVSEGLSQLFRRSSGPSTSSANRPAASSGSVTSRAAGGDGYVIDATNSVGFYGFSGVPPQTGESEPRGVPSQTGESEPRGAPDFSAVKTLQELKESVMNFEARHKSDYSKLRDKDVDKLLGFFSSTMLMEEIKKQYDKTFEKMNEYIYALRTSLLHNKTAYWRSSYKEDVENLVFQVINKL